MRSITILCICFAISHQQYPQHLMLVPPWLSSFVHPPALNNKYLLKNYDGTRGGSRFTTPSWPSIFFLNKGEEMEANLAAKMNTRFLTYDSGRFIPVKARTKDFEHPQHYLLSGTEPQKPRFILKLVTKAAIGNILLTTASFTLTSTCTSFSVTTCIPRANLRPVAPANVPRCRRKRQIEDSDLLVEREKDNSNQLLINPTEVSQVMMTAHPSSTKTLPQTEIEINSSKEDPSINDFKNLERRQRNGRLFFIGQNLVLSTTTITSFTVVSTILTNTFVPAQLLNCLPPGYFICPVAVG